MKHHIRFYLSFIRLSIVREFEFRANFVVQLASDFVWLGVLLFGAEVLFAHLKTIGGWGKSDVQLLIFVNAFFSNLLWLFTLSKLAYFSELIRSGSFDFVLTKPLTPRFVVSFASKPDTNVSQIIRQLTYFMLIILFIMVANVNVSLYQWLFFFSFIVIGFTLFYCLGFLVTTLNVWVVRLDNVHFLLDAVVDAGRQPSSIWKGVLQYLMVWIIPLGYTANFATRALLSSDIQVSNILIGVILAAGLLVASELFWRFAIMHYASASS